MNKTRNKNVHVFNQSGKYGKDCSTWMNRDVESNWKYFKENILDIVKENVPTRTVKGKADLPWFTRKIKKTTQTTQ